MLITDYLLLNAQKYPDAEAITYIDSNNRREQISWKDFDTMSNQVANFLRSQNIKKGDKVGLLLHNSIAWLYIYFGILKSGAISVLLNYNNSIDEIEYCIELADCKGLFLSRHDKSHHSLIKKNLWICDGENAFETIALFQKYSCNFETNDIFPEDVAAIYFSSGTTGRSKAILISHQSLVFAAQMELSHHNQCFEDRFLCLCPLYHTGAKIHWFGSLVVGGSIVLYNSRLSPHNLLHVIEKEKITIAFLLVPQIQDIIDAIDFGDIVLKNYNLTRWRLMHSGTQHIPKLLINQWRNYFPLQKYDTNYGLTESTGPGCIHLGTDNTHKAGSIGRVDSNWNVDIVNNGKSVVKGEIGELIIKGPGVMLGYYKDELSTGEALIDGWLHTGDMAYMDEDDFIYIVGRKKDVIISGGENVYPAQVENYLRKMPYIKDVAVIGFPNLRMGELVAAVIEFKENKLHTKKELMDYCSALPLYQRPCKFIIQKIIRNPMGKIDKAEMRRKYL